MNVVLIALLVVIGLPLGFLILRAQGNKADRAKAGLKLPKGPPKVHTLDLVGESATVTSSTMDARGGTIRITAADGATRQVPARLGEGEPLVQNAEVLVIENARTDGSPLVVVAIDLPALEDFS